jgi:hypothetical protein
LDPKNVPSLERVAVTKSQSSQYHHLCSVKNGNGTQDMYRHALHGLLLASDVLANKTVVIIINATLKNNPQNLIAKARNLSKVDVLTPPKKFCAENASIVVKAQQIP